MLSDKTGNFIATNKYHINAVTLWKYFLLNCKNPQDEVINLIINHKN